MGFLNQNLANHPLTNNKKIDKESVSFFRQTFFEAPEICEDNNKEDNYVAKV